MYYAKLKALIEAVLNKTISAEELLQRLISDIDCIEIYDSKDLLVTDAYFALKHFASGEEVISEQEWLYFIKCFEGCCKYDMNEKIQKLSSNL